MTITRRSLLVGAALLGGAAGCSPAASRPQGTATAGTSAPPQSQGGPKGPAGTRLAADTTIPLSPFQQGTLQHVMTVQAMLNGRGPYRFGIDSGSSAPMVLGAELARGLPQIGSVQNGPPGSQGSPSVPLVRVDSLSIGAAEFSGVEAVAGAGFPGVDGMIGVLLFEKLTATLDRQHQALRLSNSRLSDGPHVVAFTLDHGIPNIDIRAGGKTLTVTVDTGGPGVLDVPTSAGLPLRGTPSPAGSARIGGDTTFTISAAPLDGDLVVAGWTRHAPTVRIVDGVPIASIGAAFLNDYAVTFDLPSNRLALTQ
jgi:hypothetical protein